MPTATLNPDFDAGVRHSGTTNWNTSVAGNGTAIDTSAGITFEQAVYSGNYVCSRLYTRWDVSSIPTSSTITSAVISFYMDSTRGSQTGVSVMKLFKSDNITDSDATLYQSITSTASNTTTDVGTGTGYKTLTIDGDLLPVLQNAVSAGSKFGCLMRASTDYDNDSVSDPTIVNYRGFQLDNAANPPILYITYTAPAKTATDLSIKNGTIIIKNGTVTLKQNET